ncbi:hypothetical protein Pyn_06776 [Prunus yedoensis var. nudiflora]|uniref:Uncharacterized protein n=1 Tax=Prunus yedoensis var. nudiflora TaxID=2094558 RepID=A0A314YIB7_PRUYE|nr:hypothetical protein Pyn_06776 [Prunus yedoensis var. nudiflora]
MESGARRMTWKVMIGEIVTRLRGIRTARVCTPYHTPTVFLYGPDSGADCISQTVYGHASVGHAVWALDQRKCVMSL